MEKVIAEKIRYLRLPVLVAAIVLLASLVFTVNGSDEGLFFELLAVPCAFLLLILLALLQGLGKHWRRSLGVAGVLACYLGFSWGLLTRSADVRADVRWALFSRRYKAEVQSQPKPAEGELKHMEWDGWGFPAAGDTLVYLVFDPDNSLAGAAESGSPGKFRGLPCEVVRVSRLESEWYSVLFYTDTHWRPGWDQ